jgi:limonene-1,2-epoxide hydrolase
MVEIKWRSKSDVDIHKNEPIMDDLKPLDINSVLELWSQTYNTSGKPDWAHIFPYYHEDIIFQDPIQKVEGKIAFEEMCNKLTKRCEELQMNIISIAANQTEIFMEWEMTMIFRRTPSTTLFGCTRLTLGDDGRIIYQRDYYDLWGDIFENVPMMKKLYPSFMKRVFG